MCPVCQPAAVTPGPAAPTVTPRPHRWMSHPGWVPTGALAEEEPRAISTPGACSSSRCWHSAGSPKMPGADRCSPQHTFREACSAHGSFKNLAQPSTAEPPARPRSSASLQPATAARNTSLGERASTFHYRHTTDCRVLVQIIIQSYPRADP